MGASTVQSAITRKGQATIPKAVRDALGLKPGDKVKFFIDVDGSVAMLPVLPVTALRGIVPARPGGPVSIEEMDEAIGRAVSERDRRSRS